jgi:hypothetical protein
MRPVMQTKFPVRGNCWRAAIASLLEIGIDSMPAFEDAGHRMFSDTRTWAMNEGYSVFAYDADKPPASYAIAFGQSPRRFDSDHAIVVEDGVMVHDPHPSSEGLRDVKGYWVICRDEESPESENLPAVA